MRDVKEFFQKLKEIAAQDKKAWDAGDFHSIWLDKAKDLAQEYGMDYNNIRLLVASKWPDRSEKEEEKI